MSRRSASVWPGRIRNLLAAVAASGVGLMCLAVVTLAAELGVALGMGAASVVFGIVRGPVDRRIAHRAGVAAPRQVREQVAGVARALGRRRVPAVRVVAPRRGEGRVNAFATAHAAPGGAVLLTSAALALPRDEAVGVYAHEVGHLVHWDTAWGRMVGSVNRAVVGLLGVVVVRQGAAVGSRWVYGLDLSGWAVEWRLVCAAVVAAGVSRLADRWASRVRERSADRLAGRLVGSEVVRRGLLAVWRAESGLPEGYVPAPPGGLRGQLRAAWSTHPSVNQRIMRAIE